MNVEAALAATRCLSAYSASSLAYKSRHCKCLRALCVPHVASFAYNKDMQQSSYARAKSAMSAATSSSSSSAETNQLKLNQKSYKITRECTHTCEGQTEREVRGLLLPPSWSREAAVSFINKICINLINPGSLSESQTRDGTATGRATKGTFSAMCALVSCRCRCNCSCSCN